MINKSEFDKMRKELESYDKRREELIKQSRVVLKLSKQLIYAVQRADIKDADKLLLKAIKEKSAMDKIAGLVPGLQNEGSYSEANQEYVEAVTVLEFSKKQKLSSAKKLNVSTNDYLLGLADLTGELVRIAIQRSIKGRFDEAEKIRDFVDELWRQYLNFDFRNSQLRRKFDSIKYNLAKLEDMIYDIRLKR